jgi:hypothetical protein
MDRAFETADLLSQGKIEVTVNGNSPDKEKEKFLNDIKRAVFCNMTGL